MSSSSSSSSSEVTVSAPAAAGVQQPPVQQQQQPVQQQQHLPVPPRPAERPGWSLHLSRRWSAWYHFNAATNTTEWAAAAPPDSPARSSSGHGAALPAWEWHALERNPHTAALVRGRAHPEVAKRPLARTLNMEHTVRDNVERGGAWGPGASSLPHAAPAWERFLVWLEFALQGVLEWQPAQAESTAAPAAGAAPALLLEFVVAVVRDDTGEDARESTASEQPECATTLRTVRQQALRALSRFFSPSQTRFVMYEEGARAPADAAAATSGGAEGRNDGETAPSDSLLPGVLLYDPAQMPAPESAAGDAGTAGDAGGSAAPASAGGTFFAAFRAHQDAASASAAGGPVERERLTLLVCDAEPLDPAAPDAERRLRARQQRMEDVLNDVRPHFVLVLFQLPEKCAKAGRPWAFWDGAPVFPPFSEPLLRHVWLRTAAAVPPAAGAVGAADAAALLPVQLWDVRRFQEHLDHFSSTVRMLCYFHEFDALGVFQEFGLDHCFDCSSALLILDMLFAGSVAAGPGAVLLSSDLLLGQSGRSPEQARKGVLNVLRVACGLLGGSPAKNPNLESDGGGRRRTPSKRARPDREPAVVPKRHARELDDEAWKHRDPSVPVVMRYSAQELESRVGKRGSTLSIMDRRKFEREFDARTLRLPRELQQIYDANPHMRQVFANRREFVRHPRPFGFEDRVLLPSSARLQYRRRIGEAKTVEHWGQRKLLLSEIEFLTHCAADGDLVLYAGAAPGDHTNYLAAELFPGLRWVLVDPAPFACRPTRAIELRNEFFTDEMAREYAGQRRNLLFISDVRAWDANTAEEEKEAEVVKDMRRQEGWHEILKPKASMFKFRLPYPPMNRGASDDLSVDYLDGTCFLPAFGGRTTTECRLVVRPNADGTSPRRRWDPVVHEEQMFFHNTVRRTTFFEHSVQAEGLDHCYDCMSEIYILAAYLKKWPAAGKPALSAEELDGEVAELSRRISRAISRSRTLRLA